MDIYTSLKAKNIGQYYKNNFEKDRIVVLLENIKNDTLSILTKSETPWISIAKLSAIMGNIDITQTWCINDSPGCNKYENVWNSGKMIKSFVHSYNFESNTFNKKVEIEPIDKYNIDILEENERDM